MRGGADETEQLPEGFGLGATVGGFSLNGKPKSPAGAWALRESWLAGPPSSP